MDVKIVLTAKIMKVLIKTKNHPYTLKKCGRLTCKTDCYCTTITATGLRGITIESSIKGFDDVI